MGVEALNPRVKPSVTLRQALELAEKALGKDGGVFYCVSAVAQTPRQMREPGWTLFFGSRTGKQRFVYVLFDRRVIVQDQPPVGTA